MIKAQGLTLRRGQKVLLDNAEFVVHPGERIGIVGKNGAGKSSLLALLQGELDQDSGELSLPSSWQLASVRQDLLHQDKQRSATDFVIDGDIQLRKLQAQKQEALNKNDEFNLAQLEAQLDEIQAWSAQSRAEQLLSGLGFTPNQWTLPISTFSGGWQMRLALARALMSPSDLLLLDEPTNHLDLDAMLWLERWLQQYQGTVLLISHDTEFLNAVAKVILSFEAQKIYRYRGNYEAFLSQKAERIKQQHIALERQAKQVAKLQSFIDRFKAKASKAKQAQSRVKALERMEQLAPIQAESGLYIELVSPDSMPDPLMTLNHAAMGYPNQSPILQDVTRMIRGGDRIGVLGVNGAGKSTFIKTIAGSLPLLSGECKASKGLKIGYFAQHQLDMLDLDSSPLQHMLRIAPNSTEQQLRNYLGRFGFHGTMTTDPVKPLSGGEKSRLALAMIVWEEPNLLLLDEPSNHLDVDTREALASALAEFEGSVLLVSHDRHLLRTTVDHFWVVMQGEIIDFDGDLEDYREWLNQRLRQETSSTHPNSTEKQTSVDRKEQKRLEAQERQRLSTLRKPIINKLNTLEKRMEILQSRLNELNHLMADESLYEDARRQERMQTLEEHTQTTQELSVLENEWLELQDQLEQLNE